MSTDPAPTYRPNHAYRDAILDRINTLVDPIHTHEKQHLGNEHDGLTHTRTHTVRHPSLLNQLRHAVTGNHGHPDGGTPGFTSRPGARIDAIDALTRIEHEARTWVRQLEGKPRHTPEGDLRYLAGRTPLLDQSTLAELDHDTRSWAAGASITSGWEAPAWRPHVPCINCEETDTLRIKVDPIAAYCVACGEGWDAATIGILGNHVQLTLEQQRDVVALVDHAHDHHSGRGYPETGNPTVLAGRHTDDIINGRITA